MTKNSHSQVLRSTWEWLWVCLFLGVFFSQARNIITCCRLCVTDIPINSNFASYQVSHSILLRYTLSQLISLQNASNIMVRFEIRMIRAINTTKSDPNAECVRHFIIFVKLVRNISSVTVYVAALSSVSQNGNKRWANRRLEPNPNSWYMILHSTCISILRNTHIYTDKYIYVYKLIYIYIYKTSKYHFRVSRKQDFQEVIEAHCYVYSAFLDFRFKSRGYIRVIGLMLQIGKNGYHHGPIEIESDKILTYWCLVWYANVAEPESVRAKVVDARDTNKRFNR